MQAKLDASVVKHLHRALSCLCKYGDDLTIYATPEYFSLSTTNSSKTAYCRFHYEREFFTRYAVGNAQGARDPDVEVVESVRGQLSTKALLSILKHRAVEKSVESVDISIVEGSSLSSHHDEGADSLESSLIVKLRCKYGVTKTHRLLLQSATSVLAPSLPSSDTSQSHLAISARTVKDILEPFSGGAGADPLLVWTLGQEEVLVRSWEGRARNGGKFFQLATELSVSVEEFEKYEVLADAGEIAFHLKEFDATVAYADSMALPLSIHFTEQPVMAIYMEIEGEDAHALFIIATSQIPGQAQSQAPKVVAAGKKRPRDENDDGSTRGTGGKGGALALKPVKVVHKARPGYRTSPFRRPTGSMPPPASAGGSLSHDLTQWQHSHPSQVQAEREPLFLPSQAFDTGLVGLEDMTAEEVAEMLEGEGEEILDLSLNGDNWETSGVGDSQHWNANDGGPELEESQVRASQTGQQGIKSFIPLFED